MTSLLFILLAAAVGFWIGRGQGRGEAARQMAALQSEVEAREGRDRASQAASLSESQTALTRAQAACRAELDALNQRLAETRSQSVAAVAALRETSVLFAAVIGAVVLKEKLGLGRLAGAVGVVLGVAALKL